MGPVSSTGRAMLASLNGAMQRGMPIDQAIAYVKSMARDGVAPLADLYAMLNQVTRLQQQQVKPPQTPPTIRDNLNMAEAAQQAQMQQGLGGLDAGVMENAEYAGGGIVAFDQGGQAESEIQRLQRQRAEAYRSGDFAAMERADQAISEYFSKARREKIRGGIASIEGGYEAMQRSLGMGKYSPYRRGMEGDATLSGSPVPETTITAPTPAAAPTGQPSPFDYFAPKEASIFDTAPQIQPDEDMRRAAVRREREAAQQIPDFTAGERSVIQRQIRDLEGATPKSRAERYREAGIEDTVPGQIERIREQLGSLGKESERDRSLALAEAGFSMAEAAAKPGAKFLGSLGVGGKTGARRLTEVNKEYRTLRGNLMDKVNEMERYRQGRLEGQIDKDIEFERESAKDIRRLQKDLAGLETELGKFKAQAAITREGREMEQDPLKKLQADIIEAMEVGDDVTANKLIGRLSKLTELSPSVIIARLQAETAKAKLASQPNYLSLLNRDGNDAYADTDKLTGYSP